MVGLAPKVRRLVLGGVTAGVVAGFPEVVTEAVMASAWVTARASASFGVTYRGEEAVTEKERKNGSPALAETV